MDSIGALPQDLYALLGLAVITLGGLYRVWAEQRNQGRKVAEMMLSQQVQGVQVTEVHEQVRNSHHPQPSLREDIDGLRGVLDDVRAMTTAQGRELIGMRMDISGVRHDLATETDRSVNADSQLANELRDERERSIIADAELRAAVTKMIEPRLDPPPPF